MTSTLDLPLASAREGGLRRWWAIAWLLGVRTFRVRYLGSRLGIGWAFVQPIVQALVLTFLFTKVFHVAHADHYPLYVLTGIMTWQAFAGGANAATTSAVDNAALLRKIPMPALVFPLSQVLSVLIVFTLQLSVLLVAALAAGTLGPKVLLMPLAMVLVGVTAMGVGTLACSFHVGVRDVKFVVESGLLLAFYATPILYDPSRLPSSLRAGLAFNPMYGVVSLVRTAFMGRPVDYGSLAVSLGAGTLLLVVALAVFRRRSADFADLA